MKRIKSSYKLIEFLSGRGGADNVVNVATVEFRFGTVEKICVAGSHFGTHDHAIDL